jgi:5'(3')-deoxyribonucleotidase
MTDADDRIALIDLDGTAADYDAAMQAQLRLIRSPGEAADVRRPVLDEDEADYMKARRKLIQRQPGFWRNLKPLPMGFEVIEEMRRLTFSLHVLTKGPTSTPNAWSEKLEWCQEHIPDAAVTISGDKSLVYGRVLFDDWPSYYLKWLLVRPRGLVVCLAHPWNEDFRQGGPKEHPNVFRYDGTNRPELVSRLTKAYERAAGEAV